MPSRSFLSLLSALILVAGIAGPALATPKEVAFPAAAGIKPTTQPVGPAQIGPVFNGVGTALVPNDLVAYDNEYSGTVGGTASNTADGAILNLSVHGNSTVGTQSVLASASVGSGVAYGEMTNSNLENGILTPIAVSPAGLVYYFKEHQVTAGTNFYDDLVEVNPVTGVRRVVSDGSNTGLGTLPVTVSDICYDYSTGTILFYDYEHGNTSTAGIYRVNPSTGVRSAVSLNGGNPGSGVAFFGENSLSTDPFGNIFYLAYDASNMSEPVSVMEIPVTADAAGTYGARKVVSSNASSYPGYNTYPFNYLLTTQFDPTQSITLSGGLPTNEYLIVTDQGDDSTTSDIFRIPTNTGQHIDLINAASDAGSAVFDDPQDAQIDTTGRIFFNELHNSANGDTTTDNTINFIPVGTKTDTILSGDRDFGPQQTYLRIVPPLTPTLAAGTTSNVLGTTATLNSNVTADGGVQNAGIFQSGFVYALTSTNGTPTVGGTGVTRVSTLSLTTLPATQGANLGAISTNLTGLTAGTSYTFSAYARDISGFTYTAPITFVTATAPTVTTSAAGSITGTTASLGGNVTSAGGGSATITTRGVVYASTTTTPAIGGTGVTNLVDSGTTTGAYTDTASGLATGTTFYFRAYATNAVGTTYGSVLSFTTAAPPTATSQSVTTAFNTAKAITLTGSDPNTPAQTLTYAVTAAPSHGTLSGMAPNLTYTPTANYQGSDSFQFTTTNTSGLTSTAATVSITVAAGTPTATGQNVIASLNTAKALTLTGTDPDSPALSLTYSVATAPTHGTLSGTAPNLTYTPTTDYTGTDSFTFTVSNGQKTSAAATVSLTVVGQPYVTSFTASGAVGSTVTLTGNNFLGMTGVAFFRNVNAPTFTVVSNTQMTVVVPTGATSGVITLTNGLGTNTTPTKFAVTVP